MDKEVEIPPLVTDGMILTSNEIIHGESIPPLKRLEIFEAGSWEDFTLQLVHYWKSHYDRVVRCGGGGDMGRDVIAYSNEGPDWENFQCKHYSVKLNVSQALQEIGKLLYFAHKGQFSVPKKYYFVAPLGVSTDLLNHLMDSSKLKVALIEKWDKCCKDKISSKRGDSKFLDNSLKEFIEAVDFSIFDHIPPMKIIQLHENTPYHSKVFGTALKRRPALESPPDAVKDYEAKYIEELFLAFGDKEGVPLYREGIEEYPDYLDEFYRARKNFYAAEGLDKFSRDWLPDSCYEELLEECQESILPVIRSKYDDGYQRYLSALSQASLTPYSAHPLSQYIKVQDKKGMCHQLVNIDKVKWVGKK
jgi:hypothetical protein